MGRFLFDDRLRVAKLAAAFALFTVCCLWCRIQGAYLFPGIETCLLDPEKFNGRRIWVPSAVVVEVAEDRFIIDTGSTKTTVLGRPESLRSGDHVRIVGTFERSGREGRLRLDPGGRWDRPPAVRVPLPLLNSFRIRYAVSALVVAWILACFLRRFRLQPALPLFVSRDPELSSRPETRNQKPET